MKLIVHQSIVVYNLKVGSISNSSILQIGSSGIVNTLSKLYNTGGFSAPARSPKRNDLPLVILPSPNSNSHVVETYGLQNK
ncbi:hypothetical protein BHF71_08195 [Vulcanibacillus modesticaldus]|uniref:Uncharacterized protein n=1 Tax=Vulcanibacillus modesticaldus TaxID=337097 RepID=A0A1D2YVB4_9BACI|nr:spore germination protein GerPB [Vulcanibacillus modesticaldus]OEF99593.1 hypothetical protein BHF71_08195 [Vulcanibacillus modesticaldus]